MEFNKEDWLRQQAAGMRDLSKEEMDEYALKQSAGMTNAKQDYSGTAQSANMFGPLDGDYLAELEKPKQETLMEKLRALLNRMFAR